MRTISRYLEPAWSPNKSPRQKIAELSEKAGHSSSPTGPCSRLMAYRGRRVGRKKKGKGLWPLRRLQHTHKHSVESWLATRQQTRSAVWLLEQPAQRPRRQGKDCDHGDERRPRPQDHTHTEPRTSCSFLPTTITTPVHSC